MLLAAATPTALAMVAEAFSISGDIDRAAVYLRRAAELPPSSNMTAELSRCGVPRPKSRLGRALLRGPLPADDLYCTAARRLASPTILAFALAISAEIGWWSGQWTTAYADATEALQWATENGQPGLLGYGLSMLARIEAARGERELCQARVDKVRREVEPRGVGCMPVYSYAALGLAALGAGDLSDAAAKLQQAWDLSLPPGHEQSQRVPAWQETSRRPWHALKNATAVRQILNWLDERAQATGLAYPHAAACRARGILATEPEEAQRLFAASLAALDKVGPVPFEQARTLLCSGEAMRRDRRPVAARAPLNRALAIFDGLGARPWAARARAELAASGREGSARHEVPDARPRGAEPAGTAGCQNCRTRAEQSRGSRSPIRVPKDGRGASDEGLPQARDPLAHRTGPDPASQRHHRLIHRPASQRTPRLKTQV